MVKSPDFVPNFDFYYSSRKKTFLDEICCSAIPLLLFQAPSVASPQPCTKRKGPRMLMTQVRLIIAAASCCPRLSGSTAVA